MFADGSTETLAQFFDVQDGVPGFGLKRKRPMTEERAERARRVAAARARRELRWALMSIGADRLLTCTFHANVTERKRALEVWARFIRLVKARYPDWRFAAVMEVQQRGAWHFHAGVEGFQPVKYLRVCWRLASGSDAGNVDVQPPRSSGISGLAGYLGKYLSKAFEWMPKGSRRYFASKDRARPVIERWWLEYSVDDAEVIRSVYRLTAGRRAIGVRQWLSPDGNAYMVRAGGPPKHEDCPF